ncbi:MAG: ABC transporter ATP-binding protein [Rhizobiales bacterium]|nr:ABC transporter ATP-binding protein [Hyphomicrobiales bacterium]
MERNLFRYVWTNTRREQLWILAVVLLAMPVYFLSLDLPKRIVNGPIQGAGFDSYDTTQTWLRIELPDWLGGFELFGGFQLTRLEMLVALSLMFLSLVCVNGLFKFYINTFKGRLGERMLRRLRFELLDRLLRFPLPHFRRVKPPEVATMIKDEVEPLGGFIGDAFVQPIFLGGQAITAMLFIIVQSFWLGMMAAFIVLVQAFLIPRLRRRLIELGKQRQLTARMLAGRVGEVVDGITEVRTNDTSNYERAQISSLLGRIFAIRFELYQRKFFIKFLNNFLAQITPFLFYLVGGYFALRGQLDIGQLVAVIAAYKDLPSPIKELIDWDQQRIDVQVKYIQVIDQFDVQNTMAPELQAPIATPPLRLKGPVEANAVAISDDTGAKLLEGVTFTFAPGEQVAALGDVNAGAETTAEALARLVPLTSGRIRIADKRLDDLPEALTGRRIAYLGPETYLPNTSLESALLYGLRHVPIVPHVRSESEAATHAAAAAESRRAGNIDLDVEADWIDYEAAGIAGPEAIRDRLLEVLATADLGQDVFDLGLRGQLTAKAAEHASPRVLAARAALARRLASSDMADLVEPFDPASYSKEATIGENLLFGTALSNSFAPAELSANQTLLAILEAHGLDERLYLVGRNIAETVVELFADLPPGTPFFEQLTFMTADDIPAYASLLQRVQPLEYRDVSQSRRARLRHLALAYIEPRHRLGLLDAQLEREIIEARGDIRDRLAALPGRNVAFYDPEAYNIGASLEDNILFGRVRYGIAEGPRRVRQAIAEILDELGMRDVVFDAGLSFEVGSGGKRLTQQQRQKLALARALLKRPDLLIVNRAFASFSVAGQRQIADRVVALGRASGPPAPDGATGPDEPASGFSTFWVLSNPSLTEAFDRVLLFGEGRVLEQGTPQELKSRKESRYAKMLA